MERITGNSEPTNWNEWSSAKKVPAAAVILKRKKIKKVKLKKEKKI